ncbi:MAG: hypothetical protein HC780_27650, partial [Leptolyngbyaceae cyanobacterium CSU_1_3]|nr:hypothetical protein [Leptolyngbyaceae cyanobacterium CSU_1_3]
MKLYLPILLASGMFLSGCVTVWAQQTAPGSPIPNPDDLIRRPPPDPIVPRDQPPSPLIP